MLLAKSILKLKVNRHTGGLEKDSNIREKVADVNRHTGGLENKGGFLLERKHVNRHTGGLEIFQ